ncbi:DNA polymerase delta subunit 2 [Chytridiales sp. JEL 0842]|nr:DNA polymerase delta subunit 2 [Chytridiales sp. JEL 0842]
MTIVRNSVPYENQSSRFLVKDRSYFQQYAGLYFTRLNLMRPKVLESAQNKWNESRDDNGNVAQYAPRILDIPDGHLCYIIGTIYMDMPLKPNVLNDIAQENWMIDSPPNQKYTSEKDQVHLEDESGRLTLCGPLIKDEMFVTGTVVGVLGFETKEGDFQALDLCYAHTPLHQISRDTQESSEDTFLAIVSGLSIGNDEAFTTELQLLLSYFSGEFNNASSQIVRLLVTGNSLGQKADAVSDVVKKSNQKASTAVTESLSSLARADIILSQLCSTIPIDIMPGDNDPTNYALPQQPLHAGLLPKSSQYSTCSFVTNPYQFEMSSVRCLATSGQPTDDIYHYVDCEDKLKIAEKTLQWSHIAPTCPDTLWCYPYQDADPYVLDEKPNLYIIGNQEKFGSKLTEGIAV